MMKLVQAVLVSLLAASTVSAQDTLPDVVKRHGRAIRNEVSRQSSPALPIEDLAKTADFIARVSILDSGISQLTSDKRAIHTVYKVLVLDRLFAREASSSGVMPGQTIVVTKPGGRLTIEGIEVTSVERDFPPFENGDEYVLFLSHSESVQYRIANGAQGAFKSNGGMVEQISAFGLWNYERDGAKQRASLEAFVSELRNALPSR